MSKWLRLVTFSFGVLTLAVSLSATPAAPAPTASLACEGGQVQPLFLAAEGGGDPVLQPVVDPRLCVRRCNQIVRACSSFCAGDANCVASCELNYNDCVAACPGGGL